MRIAAIKYLDRRKQHLTDVVRALNLRVAEIKRSPPGDRHPAAPVAKQHFPASGKMHADLVLQHHPARRITWLPSKRLYAGTAKIRLQCLGNSTGCPS